MALGNNLKKQSGHKENVSGNSVLTDEQHGKATSKLENPQSVQLTKPIGKVSDLDNLQSINQEVSSATGTTLDSLMLIVFSVGKEEYALAIDMVSEVVKTPPITPIPQVPDYIKGVTNVRGNVVTILDLALKLGFSHDEKREPNHLMVIKSEEFRVAVGIDQVPNTLMVDKSEIDHSSEVMLHSTLDEVYIKGVIKKGQRMIILIDILEMMETEEFTD